MFKLDISTSQIVNYEGEEAVIRYISKDRQKITLEDRKGRLIEAVSPEELLDNNPDIIYEEV